MICLNFALLLFLVVWLCLVPYCHGDLEAKFDLSDSFISGVSLRDIAKESEEFVDFINSNCLQDLQSVSVEDEWVWRMLDSAGKLPHGILRLNTHNIGQYAECIKTSFTRPSESVVTGRHCMLQTTINIPLSSSMESKVDSYHANLDWVFVRTKLKLKDTKILNRPLTRNDNTLNITLSTGLCFPSSCSPSDINLVLSNIEIPSNYINISSVEIFEPSCTVDHRIEWTAGRILTITFLTIIVLVMLWSTAYDIRHRIAFKGDIKDQRLLFVTFSVYTNTKRLFTPSKNPGPLACMHGIRVLSMFWIIFCHRYYSTIFSPIENYADFMEWFSMPRSSLIAAGAVSVDTFLLMSGFLLSYVFFKSAKKGTILIHFYFCVGLYCHVVTNLIYLRYPERMLKDLPMFYFHRILRLTPLLAVVVLLNSTIIDMYGNGPFKYIVDLMFVEPCVEAWWTTILYVQNYVGTYMCTSHSWYLAVDMQLYIISPLLLYPFLWNKKLGIIWTSFCIAVAQITAFVIVYIHAWPAGLVNRGIESSYEDKFYIATHARATPYFIGILAGYLVQDSFKKKAISTIQYRFLRASFQKKILVIFGWLCCLTLLGSVVFGNYPLNQIDHEFSHWEDTMYNAFHRTAWTMGILWIIIACGYGFGGPINWLLSLRAWEVLGRFTYALYLIHLSVQVLQVTNQNHVTIFNDANILYNFFGDLVTCLAISYVLILAFESPIATLEKIIFKKDNKITKKVDTHNNNRHQKHENEFREA